MRIQDRIDSCKNSISVASRGLDELRKQLMEQEQEKKEIAQQIQQLDDNNYKSYLLGLIHQGDLAFVFI
jgi:kinesin family protein 18/19